MTAKPSYVPALATRLRADFSASKLARAFLYLVIPLGLVFVYLTPPGDVPDEGGHLQRAEAMLHGEFVGQRRVTVSPYGHTMPAAGTVSDPAVIWASSGWPAPAPAWVVPLGEHIDWAGKIVFIQNDPLAVYFPLYYIAPAIGLAIGKRFRDRPYDAIFIARLLNFATYALLGLLTLTMAKFGHAVLFVILAMPMTLYLAASANPDGALIATSCLGFALLTASRRRAAAFCLAAVILVKPPYALLALAILFPVPSFARFWAERRPLPRRLGLAILTVLPGLIWFIWTSATVAAAQCRPAYHPGPMWPGNPATVFYAVAPAAQLQSVIAHPIGFLHMFAAATLGSWRLLAQETIGLIGYQDVFLPGRLYVLWGLAAAMALLSEIAAGPIGRTTSITSIFALADCAATVLLVWLSQYLVWTDVGTPSIQGPAGRYLLPILPLLIFVLPRLTFPGAALLRGTGTALPILAALVDLAFLPGWFAHHVQYT
jgi:hypothetical protein